MKKILLFINLVCNSCIGIAQWIELGGNNAFASIHRFDTSFNQICDMTSDIFGNIYAVGFLQNNAGNLLVAKYDGTQWNSIGSFTSRSYAVCSDKIGNIFASFSDRMSSSLNSHVAQYNGSSWTILGGANALFDTMSKQTNTAQTIGNVEKICSDNFGNIYAVWNIKAGQIYINGAFLISEFAKWNGTNWNNLGYIPLKEIRNICSDNFGNIYVTDSSSVAKWNGTNWSILNGLNLKNNGYGLCTDKYGNVYATSNALNSSGHFFVSKWDGINWSELGGANSTPSAYAFYKICSDSFGNIYTNGRFANSTTGKEYILKYNGVNWDSLEITNLKAGYLFQLINDNFGNLYTTGDFRNSSRNFYVAQHTQPLPLKLISFIAQKENNNILLNWQTVNEINVSHFNIQRSINGKEFTIIGNTNTKGANTYFFKDNDFLLATTIYYRLEIVDKDGSKTYSNIQTINNKLFITNKLIFPNPAKEQITITGNFSEVVINDNTGKVILTKQLNFQQNQTILNLSELTKGIYFIQCINKDKTITEKLIVE